jgi:prevent-host-death family protein
MNAAVRDLKTHLSAYLRKVKEGEQVIITDHGKPCAIIQPFLPDHDPSRQTALKGNPNFSWNGNRLIPPEPVDIGGRPLSDMVMEDRE